MRRSIVAGAAGATAVYAQQNCASPVTGTIVQPSGQPQITACANSLGLGEPCGADEQCMNGAQCWGSNANIIRACGNFNAACTRDDQCAYNTCNEGLCVGFLASSNYPTLTATATTPTSPANAAPTPPSFCPEVGSIGPGGAVACNPAQNYPGDQTCEMINGCFFLVSATTGAGSATTPGASLTTSASISAGPTSSSANSTTPVTSTGIPPQPTSSPVSTDGGASVVGPLSGLGAFIAGVAAFIL